MRVHSRLWTVLVVFLVISVLFGTSGWAPTIVSADLSDPPPPQQAAEDVGVTEPITTATEETPKGAPLENRSDPAAGRADTPTLNQEPVIDGIAADRTVGTGCT